VAQDGDAGGAGHVAADTIASGDGISPQSRLALSVTAQNPILRCPYAGVDLAIQAISRVRMFCYGRGRRIGRERLATCA
jgi:hypothetical protein